MEQRGSIQLGTFVLFDDCFAGIVLEVSSPGDTATIQVEEYWPLLDLERECWAYGNPQQVERHLKEMCHRVGGDFKLPKDLETRPRTIIKLTVPHVRVNTWIKRLTVIPLSFPSYTDTLQRHFQELLKMTRERVKCVKERPEKDYFGFTKPNDLYFGAKGRCDVSHRFVQSNVLSCAPKLWDTATYSSAKRNLPERGEIIYHMQVGKKPCWFLASDYPGLDEFLGYLKGFRREPPVEYEWVAAYFTEDAQEEIQWAYLLEEEK